MAEEKKIIVDEDWKDEAQHEKEKLAEQEAVEKEEKEKEEEQKKEPTKLPPGDFAALMSLLTSQALFAMGLFEVEGQKKEPDMEMARYNIDMLTTLQEKTKGNLTEQETAVLESTISQVRMAFVKVTG